MQRYVHSTGFIDLGTNAAGSIIWVMSNPALANKGPIPGVLSIIKKLHIQTAFTGTIAAAITALALGRATGTAAGASSSTAVATTARRYPNAKDPFSTLFFGTAPITGMTPDAFGDMAGIGIMQQLVVQNDRDVVWDDTDAEEEWNLDNAWVLMPGTSFTLTQRQAASIAGVKVCIDIEWCERPISGGASSFQAI